MREVVYEKRGNFGLLQIARPDALNALSREIVTEIGYVIERIRQDAELHALLIYSEGNFAAGADIGDMVECNETEAREFVFSPVFNQIEKLPIPTVAAIEGYALGGGLELALTCDIRFASETAKMGFPEINLGIMPGAGGTVRATKLIGSAAAKELIFSGKTISAQRALALGLVNRVVPEKGLFKEAEAFVQKLAEKAPIALRTAKYTIDCGLEAKSKESAILQESENWASLFRTKDQKEGMRAFLEKRNPQYQGK